MSRFSATDSTGLTLNGVVAVLRAKVLVAIDGINLLRHNSIYYDMDRAGIHYLPAPRLAIVDRLFRFHNKQHVRSHRRFIVHLR